MNVDTVINIVNIKTTPSSSTYYYHMIFRGYLVLIGSKM